MGQASVEGTILVLVIVVVSELAEAPRICHGDLDVLNLLLVCRHRSREEYESRNENSQLNFHLCAQSDAFCVSFAHLKSNQINELKIME